MSPIAYLLIAAVGHVVLWVTIVNRIHGVGIARKVVDGITIFSGAALVCIPLWVLWLTTSSGGPAEWWPPQVAGATSCYVAVCAAFGLWATVVRIWSALRDESHGAQVSFTAHSVDLAESLGTDIVREGTPRRLSQIPGNQLLQLSIEEEELAIPGLPNALDGLRIAHLSDLHMSGRVGVEYFEKLAELTLAAQPDVIVLTGDLVEYPPQMHWVSKTLGRLTAPEGVYFVLGNHDLKIDHQRLRTELTALGQVDLGGGTHDTVWRDTVVHLVGNEVPWFKPAGTPVRGSAEFAIGLTHSPDQFGWAKRHGINLLLAGHNHGGQIRFPLLGAIVTPSIYGTRYASGVFKSGSTVMHVSRGAGSLAPLRFGCPPELSILTLRTDGK